ncbi:hypothetical protein MLD38_003290 [Melastoma candidum]|uniref:Uncharacterized protein n=1 Tax=Melastoma candidum TaxID=119954 RepID=A0ACB9S2C5_9MYRT|nr:hypothetical protein MLD38_003290 [Melastoma candidum]
MLRRSQTGDGMTREPPGSRSAVTGLSSPERKGIPADGFGWAAIITVTARTGRRDSVGVAIVGIWETPRSRSGEMAWSCSRCWSFGEAGREMIRRCWVAETPRRGGP